MFSCLCAPGYIGTSCETGLFETVKYGSYIGEHNSIVWPSVNIDSFSSMVGNLNPDDDKRTRTNRYLCHWLHGSHMAYDLRINENIRQKAT